MRLFIKNIVCPRCISSVEQLLKNNKLQAKYVRLGETELAKDPGEKKLKQFADDLKRTGFKLLDDSRKQLIEKMKNIIITQVSKYANIKDTKVRKLADSIIASQEREIAQIEALLERMKNK